MAQLASVPGPIRARDLAAPSLPWPQRVRRFVVSPPFLWGVVGLAAFFLAWYLLVDVFRLWSFARLPSLVKTVKEWLNPDPVYGFSIFTEGYYVHILASVQRVFLAFVFATVLGVAIGLLMGWRRIFFGLTFPILELLSEKDVLLHVIIPGALPYIFIGLQIGIAACWFSLVASEIVSGQSGMGYQVWQTYYYQQYETMVIFMVTLGSLGWGSSAIVRAIGNRLMRWRAQMLGGI
jgi:NitT/TauT family transport system permease protein